MTLDVDPTRATGRWWRHVPAGADPLRRPSPPGDNRWQRGSIIDALYLAEGVACVWAEWYRHLAEAAIPPGSALPRDLWRYRITGLEVADLSDAARLARVGLSTLRPGRWGWHPYQAVGEQLHEDGWRGLVASSAAHPTSLVLVVFIPRGAHPDDVVPIASTQVGDVPVPPTGMRT
ncbi:MAG: RES family NAD+ phosphorylase [Actinomycetota bacterium]|nr:RES family NAD+ phosphorylase [Actinomycetota bacterium]